MKIHLKLSGLSPHCYVSTYCRKGQQLLLLGIALITLLAAPNSTKSQAYEVVRFTPEESKINPYIYCINQDKDGFLWLGTADGLYRFDGMTFLKFDTTTSGLSENFISTSYVDRKGNLWLGHYLGGISFLGEGSTEITTVLKAEEGISTITGIHEDIKGNIWLASQRGALIRITPNDTLEILRNGLKEYYIVNILSDAKGKLYLGTDQGLYTLEEPGTVDSQLKLTPVNEIPPTTITSIVQSRDKDEFWVGTQDEGFYYYIPQLDSAIAFTPQKGYRAENIQSIYEDNAKRVWIGTPDLGFLKYSFIPETGQLTEITPLGKEDSLDAANVRTIYQDRYGQIWLGTYGEGLLCMAEDLFTLYTPQEEEEQNNYTSLLEDAKGNLWYGCDKGIFKIDASSLKDHGFHYTRLNKMPLTKGDQITEAEGLPDLNISALYQDPKGIFWIGTENKGVIRLDPGTGEINQVELGDGNRLSNSINAICSDKDGDIWIATKEGAFRYDDVSRRYDFYSTRNKLAHNNIYDILPDSKGRIWFATHTNRISLLENETINSIPVQVAGEVPSVNCITEDGLGNIWIGTDGNGVYKYSEGNWENFSEGNGLISNYCYEIVADNENNIWVGHRAGLSRYIAESGEILQYENNTYLPLEETYFNASLRDKTGNLWFSTSSGLIRYNSYRDGADTIRPSIRLTSFFVFDEKKEIKDGLKLDYKKYRIKFEFLGLTFVNQENVQYEYILEGNDPDWSYLTTRNSVTYQGLGAGKYNFKVRARNKRGLYSRETRSFSFEIEEPFWNTLWFRIAVVILVALMIFLFVRYRTYRLNKEKEELERKVSERTQELQEANLELELLSLVARETDNAVFILAPGGELQWVNEGFSKLTGYEINEFMSMYEGKKFLDTSSNPEARTLLQDVIRKKEASTYESRLPSKEGEDIWVISTLNPVYDQNGDLRNIVIVDSNITERKQAEEKIQAMNQELERLVEKRTEQLAQANEKLQKENEEHIKTAERVKAINKELDLFIYRSSHDLKGPLSTLIGLLNIAKMDIKDDQAIQYFEMADGIAGRLDSILMDLLDATRIKQETPTFTLVTLETLVGTIEKNFLEKHKEHDFHLNCMVPQGLEIHTDPEILTVIIQNLMDNSYNYRDEKKDQAEIEVKVEGNTEGVWIKVRDNGKGIPDRMQKKVFQMFFKGTSTSKGTGLGLYIVRNALEKLQGKVELESKVGEGTTFSVYIPSIREETPETA